MSKLISIIIPTFNRSERLSNLLALIVSEDIINELNIVVVDDFSTEFHRKALEKLKTKYPNVIFEFNKMNRGACYSRNVGIKKANSDWYWFFDDDDLIDAVSINKVITRIKSSELEKLIFLSSINIGSSYSEKIIPNGKAIDKQFYNTGHEVNTSCVLFSKELLGIIQCWDESLVAGQDTDIFLRASMQVKNATVFENVFVSFINHEGERITKNPWKQMKGKIQFIKKHHKNISCKRLFYYVITTVFFVPYLKKIFCRFLK
ncbi:MULTISPECIES: glycosyltransferase [unclassified Pseudoalteromonas]|uniref:glycosyltransferase n=1 Tax=unclassified Pseudoalteromonas TaxID=194690 RepID=UPI0025B3F632|nr:MULTISPECIES: glycosyltransferase [unclassified Pseudoalteromonas]MDN3379128.1 glycosyltransferase [Pseudoalteromonas sp. APC 3893]MDN3389222.1 glycosyltransferase [Pseudoalteromonas sp. APC 4017]